MPTWRIRCQCGGNTSKNIRYAKREELGGAPCLRCGEINKPLPTSPNLLGFGKEKGTEGEVTTEQLRKQEQAGKEILLPGSPERQRIYEQAREAADKQAQAFGYRDVEHKSQNWAKDKKKWHRAKQKQEIDRYHDKHGSKGKKTVEQAFGND